MNNLIPILHTLSAMVLPLLFAITLHEAAHGYVASRLGDKTALMMGRVTLNPIKHISLFGTIILPLFVFFMSRGSFLFGWAKPVPVTWQNLNNPRRDMALVALAGPAANLFMALLWAAIVKGGLWMVMHTEQVVLRDVAAYMIAAGNFGIIINLILMLLNLIPLPPLDGSRVVSAILPPRLAARYEILEPYGIWILLALLFLGGLQWLLIGPLSYCLFAIAHLFNLPLAPGMF